ncbi:MAG: hypothetical protein GY845_30815 [Planctomycetes bacterium]|nr:hypothetical protein [Planctomycetota bacterium]
MKKRKTNQLKLWVTGVLTIVLLAAPSGWALVTYDDGGQHVIETDPMDDVEVRDGTTVNLRSVVTGYLQVHPDSVLNIYSGSVFWYVIVSSDPGQPEPQVTVYGTDFIVDGVPTTATEFTPIPADGSVLNGLYEHGVPIEPTMLQPGLWFFSDIPIKLKDPASEEENDDLIIDIKPGSDTNCINLKSRGVVPVAVMTTDNFQAGNINPDSVEFAGASPLRSSLCDVDKDGDMDMLFHFRTQKLNLDETSTEATLKAMLKGASMLKTAANAGNVMEGTDKVKIMSSKKHRFSKRYAPKHKKYTPKQRYKPRHKRYASRYKRSNWNCKND